MEKLKCQNGSSGQSGVKPPSFISDTPWTERQPHEDAWLQMEAPGLPEASLQEIPSWQVWHS